MRRFRRHLATTVVLLAIARTGAAQTVTATFPVGSVEGGKVSAVPSVVVGGDGSVLILWRDFYGKKSTTLTRRYSAVGLPLGAENRLGAVDIGGPTVHADRRGGYIATWRDASGDPPMVVAQRLTAAGAPVRDEITFGPEVSVAPVSGAGISSGFAFAWSRSGLFVSLYDADGVPIELFIYAGSGGGVSDVLPLPDGGFLVTWTGLPVDGALARLFDADGTPRGPEIRVSEYLAGPNQFTAARVAVAPTGAFTAVGARRAGTNTEIVARRFDAAGVPLADAFVVDSAPSDVAPDVAYDATGNLYVVWSAAFPTVSIPNPPLVRARAYDVTGTPIGPSAPISTSPGFGVRTAALPSGGFVNVWYAADQGFAAVVSLCAPGTAVCGDGVFVSQCEECDAGGANDDTIADACRTVCRVAHCGDGVVDGGEQCDDHNAIGCDGCSATCQLEQGTGCGDGIHEPSCEACDDGNAASGDGCTPQCALERIPGGGAPASDCFSEWIVEDAANTPLYDVHGAISGKQTCADDDPRCDFDGGIPGSCTFHVQACADNTDSVACQRPARLAAWTLVRPSAAQAASHPEPASVRQALASVPGELVGPSAANVCTPVYDVPVALRGAAPAYRKSKVKLKNTATSYEGVVDSDAITLTCLPRR